MPVVHGVVVPVKLAAELLPIVEAHIARARGAESLALRRLREELTRVASTSGQNLAPAEPPWSTADEVAITLNVSARTVRRRAETGDIERRRRGRQWEYRATGNDGS